MINYYLRLIKKTFEESNKNFEKLLNEKNIENEKLKKNYKKVLEEQKILIDEVNSNKEKELLDKDNKLKEFKEQNIKLNQINEENNNEIILSFVFVLFKNNIF